MSDEIRDNPDYARILDALRRIEDFPEAMIRQNLLKDSDLLPQMNKDFHEWKIVFDCLVEDKQAQESNSKNRWPSTKEVLIQQRLQKVDETLQPDRADELKEQLNIARHETEKAKRDYLFSCNDGLHRKLSSKIEDVSHYIKDSRNNPIPKGSRPDFAKRLVELIDAMSNIGFVYDLNKYKNLKNFSKASRGGDSIGGVGNL